MLLVEFVVYTLLFYIFAGVLTYLYGVIKSWEITGFWDFSISDRFIAGICAYPKWLLWWIELIARKFNIGK